MAAKTPAQRRQLLVARTQFQIKGMIGNLGPLPFEAEKLLQEDPESFPGVSQAVRKLKTAVEELYYAAVEAQQQVEKVNNQLKLLNAAKKKISKTSETNGEGG